MREGNRSFEIDRRAAPPPYRRQCDMSSRARIHLAVIQRPTAIELPLVEAIKKPGREIGGDDLPTPQSNRSFEEHGEAKSGAGVQSSPAHPFRRGCTQIPA
jgi:hypothetical protein